MASPSTFTFRLSPEMRQRLEAEALATGKSLAEITTEALTAWLDSGGFGAQLRDHAQRLAALEALVGKATSPDPGPFGLVRGVTPRKTTPVTADKVTKRTRQPDPVTSDDPGGWLTTRQAFELSGLPKEKWGTFRAQINKGRLPEWERHPDEDTLSKGAPWLRKKIR